jgi:hypothetical protein
MNEKKAEKMVVAYELLRFFALAASLPLRPVRFLPVSWFAAVPLLALPPILAVLSAFYGDVGGAGDYSAFKRLYALAKVLSAVGIAAYIVSTVVSLGRDGSLAPAYSAKHLIAFLLFFFVDILLAARHKKRRV